MAITLRNTKGTALTHAELDGNFTELDSRVGVLENAPSGSTQTLSLVGETLSISDGNSVDLSSLSGDADTNTFLDSAAFDDSTGTLTLTKNDASTVTVNLDGRYLTSETDSQTLTLTGTDLNISGGNTVDLSTILSAEADTLATVTARGATSSASIDMDGNNIQNINTLTPGSITQSDTGDFTSNFATTITQDNQYTKFTKVDVFDDGETPAFTVNREIKLGANSLLFDSTVGATAVVRNDSVGGSLILEAGSGNADEGDADGGDIVITSGYAGVGGDGGDIILNSNADIFVGPLANTLDIRIGGGPGYAGENNTFFYGNVNIDSGKKLNGDVTGSVFADDSTLLVDAVNGKIVGDYENGSSTISSTRIASYDVEALQDLNTVDSYVNGTLYGGATANIKNLAIGSTAPSTSNGASGDRSGMVAFDSTYIYYCTANYTDGVADIWKRVAWSTDTW